MCKEFKSYIEACQAWLDGQTIQWQGTNEWLDWEGSVSPENIPPFEGEMWRVTPGEYYWIRLYKTQFNGVASFCASSKDSFDNQGSFEWCSEPVLVKLSE